MTPSGLWAGPTLGCHGREGGGARGGPRVPHHPPRAGHPRRRRPSPAGHPPPGEGPAPGGGRAAGRGQPRVLRAAGARPGHRAVGRGRRCRRRRPASGRRRTRPPRTGCSPRSPPRPASGAGSRRRTPVTPGIRVLLDALDHLPAVVFNGRLDILAVNALGRALYAPVYDLPGRPNSARFLFLDEPRARDLFPEWDRIAGDTVAMLRIEAGRHPDDPELIELIGQLSTRSTAFRTRWAGQRRPGAPGRHQGLPAPAHRRGHAALREPARRRRLRPGAHRLHPAARQPRGRRDPPAGQLERRQRAEREPDSRNRRPDT